jgi:hypothetical protein
MFVSTILYGLVALWTGCLAFQQMAMVSAETTTFEAMHSGDHALVPRRILSNPGKALRNLAAFFFSGRYVVTCEGEGGCGHLDHDHGHHHDHV